jgi:hypothetical protein
MNEHDYLLNMRWEISHINDTSTYSYTLKIKFDGILKVLGDGDGILKVLGV